MILFLVLIVTSVALAVYFYCNKTKDYWKKRNVVQVNGTFSEFVFGNKSLGEVYKKVYEDYPNEPYVGIFVGWKPALIVRDLANVQWIFSTDFYSFNHRGIAFNKNDTLADNVLMINDAKRWKLLRQKLTPMFTSMKLKNMFYILDTCAQDFVKRIKECPQIVEMPYDAMLTYTASSITASVFGIDANIKNTMDNPILKTAKKSLELTLKARIINTMASFSPSILNTLNLKAFGPYEDFFIGAFRRAVESRKEDGEKRHDLVDLCLELQKQGIMKDPTTDYEIEPTIEVIAAQGWFFFLAGTDTSANTMHFTLLELATHTDILNRAHEEIDKVFNECDEKLSYNDVEKLKYLDMVYSEAMRKYPPIGLLTRKCTKTSKLPVGDVIVEKDVSVIVPAFGIHRDPKYYPDPEKFDPERFSPENAAKIPKYANLSFGEGSRICIGNRYARLQVKAGLAWILRKFTLRHQEYKPTTFEPSFFATKDSNARYELIPRN